MDWRNVLDHVLNRVAGLLGEEERTRWALIGSAATALQGCSITPNDLDFLTETPAGVDRFAELMMEYTPPSAPVPLDHDGWLSSQEVLVSGGPDPYGFHWRFARWMVGDFKVEVAHIVPPPGFRMSTDGAGIWEAGPEIWPNLRILTYDRHRIPVVPLEIQLETCLARGLDERVACIRDVLRHQGTDAGLLHRALREAHHGLLPSLTAATDAPAPSSASSSPDSSPRPRPQRAPQQR